MTAVQDKDNRSSVQVEGNNQIQGQKESKMKTQETTDNGSKSRKNSSKNHSLLKVHNTDVLNVDWNEVDLRDGRLLLDGDAPVENENILAEGREFDLRMFRALRKDLQNFRQVLDETELSVDEYWKDEEIRKLAKDIIRHEKDAKFRFPEEFEFIKTAKALVEGLQAHWKEMARRADEEVVKVLNSVEAKISDCETLPELISLEKDICLAKEAAGRFVSASVKARIAKIRGQIAVTRETVSEVLDDVVVVDGASFTRGDRLEDLVDVKVNSKNEVKVAVVA